MLTCPAFCAITRITKQHKLFWIERVITISCNLVRHFMVYLKYSSRKLPSAHRALFAISREKSILEFFRKSTSSFSLYSNKYVIGKHVCSDASTVSTIYPESF